MIWAFHKRIKNRIRGKKFPIHTFFIHKLFYLIIRVRVLPKEGGTINEHEIRVENLIWQLCGEKRETRKKFFLKRYLVVKVVRRCEFRKMYSLESEKFFIKQKNLFFIQIIGTKENLFERNYF